MVNPMLEEDYKEMPLEDIIKTRQELLKEINDYEMRYILNPGKIASDVVVTPTSETIYSINNDNLLMLTKLIKRKLERAYWYDEDDEEYYVLTVTYDDSSFNKEYNYLSKDTTIKKGDKVIVERRNQEVVATVIDTEFCTEWDAPYPIEETKYIVEKILVKEPIEIVKENIESINYEKIIAVTVAESGAMGEPNGFYAVTDVLKLYHLNFANSEIPFNELKEKFTVLNKLNCGIGTVFALEEGWKWFNLGYGNYLMIREKYADLFEKYTKALLGAEYKPSTLYGLWLHILRKIIIKNG